MERKIVDTSHADNASPFTIPALDGLRGIACIFVVISHIPKYVSEATDLFRFTIHHGEPGVALFFV